MRRFAETTGCAKAPAKMGGNAVLGGDESMEDIQQYVIES